MKNITVQLPGKLFIYVSTCVEMLPRKATNSNLEKVRLKISTTWKIVVSALMLQMLTSPSQYYQKYVFRGFVQLIESKKCRNVCFQLSADFHIFASN